MPDDRTDAADGTDSLIKTGNPMAHEKHAGTRKLSVEAEKDDRRMLWKEEEAGIGKPVMMYHVRTREDMHPCVLRQGNRADF